MAATTSTRRLSRVIRKHQLPEFVGLKRSAIDRLIAADPTFPKPFTTTDGGRAQCWFEEELAVWQERRRAAREVA